jgi:hypothetical protein
MLAGRSMTSPAAILVMTVGGNCKMRGMKLGIGIPEGGRNVGPGDLLAIGILHEFDKFP